MAGSIITMPVNGAADWSAFPSIVVAGLKSYMFVSLSNFTGNSAPEVEDGSYLTNNGSFYKLTANGATEAIGGLAAIANSSTIYFYHVPGTYTLLGSITVPAWSETKGGYYNGDDRCFGGCYKDASGNYINKYLFPNIYEGPSSIGITYINAAGTESFKHILKKVIEIGDWNMDATAGVSIAHEVDALKIINFSVLIRSDSSNYYTPIIPEDIDVQHVFLGSVTFDIIRKAGGIYDSINYDSTGYNRGIIHIEYYE